MTALNPFIQIFKRFLLAWLPTSPWLSCRLRDPNEMFPEGLYHVGDHGFVVLHSVSSIRPMALFRSTKTISMSSVLQLGVLTKTLKWSSRRHYLIFLRDRGFPRVGWMAIASEMLAQNPGLGKFVWTSFKREQRFFVPHHGRGLTIGIIGFILTVSWSCCKSSEFPSRDDIRLKEGRKAVPFLELKNVCKGYGEGKDRIEVLKISTSSLRRDFRDHRFFRKGKSTLISLSAD